ncbi:MAG TPA: bifunctional DNA-formamidopyrimidine glycosylase/DNA-(apurinic or apyrimidinic site) lyase [Acidisarcina sp.]
MPELPEVETIANGVNARVAGQVIESAWFGTKPQTFRTPAEEMAEQLPGRRIDRVRRVGKHIVFDLGPLWPGPTRRRSQVAPVGEPKAPDVQWIVHLGMTGRLLVSEPDTLLPVHTHAILRLSSGNELRFVDPRRFGRLSLLMPDDSRADAGTPAPTKAKANRQKPKSEKRASARPDAHAASVSTFGFKGPGLEPLTISAEDFIALFRKRRISIKSALLNQRLLHGVGNIYADESLFRAGIRPRRMAGRLKHSELLALRTSLLDVLREAIALGGSSVSDYVDATGLKGYFQLEHRVYQRTGKPCIVCGAEVRRIVLGGRSTHYCAHCQR